MKLFPALFLLFLIFKSYAAEAQDCYVPVLNFATGICGEFLTLEGSSKELTLNTENIEGNASRLLDRYKELFAGANNGAASLTTSEFVGLFRKDLPKDYSSVRNCRLEIAKSFYPRMCRIDEVDLSLITELWARLHIIYVLYQDKAHRTLYDEQRRKGDTAYQALIVAQRKNDHAVATLTAMGAEWVNLYAQQNGG